MSFARRLLVAVALLAACWLAIPVHAQNLNGPIYKWKSVSPAFSDMLDRRVHIIGMGDSNWAFGGYGHRQAIAKALTLAGLPCSGTGPVPIYAIGYAGYSSRGYASGGGTGVSDPDTERNALDNSWGHAFTIEECNVSAGATPTVTKTGAFAALTIGSTGRVYLDNMSGSPTTTAGIYTFTTSTADSITLSSSPTGGSAKTGGTRVTEVLVNDTNNVRGNLRNVSQFGFGYVNDAGTVAAGTASQLFTTWPNVPFDNRLEMTYSFYYGTFVAGTGSFTLQGRSPYQGYAAISGGPTVNPVTGANGMAVTTWNLPAVSQRLEVEIGVTRTGGGTAITGPFFGTHSKLELTGARNGYDFATIYQQGGESQYDMLNAMESMTDAQVDYYLDVTRDVRGTLDARPHTWIITTQSGGNDRNETQASIGPDGPFTGDSDEAYVDNAKGIYFRLRDRIVANYPNDRVVFLHCITHPHYTAGTEDAKIATYRTSMYALADSRTDTAVINFGHGFFGNANTWVNRYDAGGTDNAHLDTNSDYDEVWTPLMEWIADEIINDRLRGREYSGRGWGVR